MYSLLFVSEAYISRGIHEQIFAANRTPIVWEEMLLQWNVSLNKQVLVQVWQSEANIKLTTSMGYKVPSSPRDLFRIFDILAYSRLLWGPMITGIWTVDEVNGLISDLKSTINSTPS